ncbi:hypothetical protein SuNHUV7_36440 (plasmid) [Pseudoseohaeicola sp. NH-UV-7]|uniref:zinc uptake protein ZrgA n=1 Tax=unclassified Sulfitobacter TaxID=196795 RepID=UPI000E0C8BF8|nr:DUF2796 domain-containing protein [Sulfitobacter sp. JL08]AXI56885.1 DUF2796 domain-containing protein [Sulfitobacter sp. JL08]
MNKTSLMIALMAPSMLFAQETRDLGAHEHGHSALNIAIENGQIAMELEAPGADIVGFEYAAETAEDRAKLDTAIATLSKPLSLFVLPAAAGCTVTSSSAGLIDGHHDDHDDHANDDHAKEEGDDHAHDDHAKEEEAGHTEFHAEYLLTCADPSAVNRIEFAFFEAFPNAQEVEVQMISDKGSQGFEVERDAPVLDLSGLI